LALLILVLPPPEDPSAAPELELNSTPQANAIAHVIQDPAYIYTFLPTRKEGNATIFTVSTVAERIN